MTHSTVFPCTSELEEAFAAAKAGEGGSRTLKVVLENETIALSDSLPGTSDVVADLEAAKGLLEPKKPCYLLFRADDAGAEWILIAYTPDGSPVKDRMLYASSRDTVKKELGRASFKADLYGSSLDDITWDAYEDIKNRGQDAPLTQAEVQYRAEASMEVDSNVGGSGGVGSVRFPLSADAKAAISGFAKGQLNLVVLGLDLEKETVEKIMDKSIADVVGLATDIPSTQPSFGLFRYSHTFNGEEFAPVVFIYTCPNSCKIKEKMLYSTVKAVVAGVIEVMEIKIEKKFEVDDPADLDEDFFNCRLHEEERKVVRPSAFTRPKAGGRRPATRTRKPRE